MICGTCGGDGVLTRDNFGLHGGETTGPCDVCDGAGTVTGVFEFDIENAAVGPRVKIWGEVDADDVEVRCPPGWGVDWETTPASLDSTRGGARGYAHPLVPVQS